MSTNVKQGQLGYLTLFECRSRPAFVETTIPLGVLIEWTQHKSAGRFTRSVSWTARIELEERELEGLSPMIARMLKRPYEYVQREVFEKLSSSVHSRDPLAVLPILASEHPWSIYFSEPIEVRVVGAEQHSRRDAMVAAAQWIHEAHQRREIIAPDDIARRIHAPKKVFKSEDDWRQIGLPPADTYFPREQRAA